MATLLTILNIIFWFSVIVIVVTYIINSLTDWTDEEVTAYMKVFSIIALIVAAIIFIIKYTI